MAGDLEPTAGEVIKSSKDLRVAFLRQEFVDELVMERSLKEELLSVFTEEAAILGALKACEVREQSLLASICGNTARETARKLETLTRGYVAHSIGALVMKLQVTKVCCVAWRVFLSTLHVN